MLQIAIVLGALGGIAYVLTSKEDRERYDREMNAKVKPYCIAIMALGVFVFVVYPLIWG